MILTDESLAWLDHILQQSPDTRLSADDGRKLLADLREARGLIDEFLGIDLETVSAVMTPAEQEYSGMLLKVSIRMAVSIGRVTASTLSADLREALNLDALGAPS